MRQGTERETGGGIVVLPHTARKKVSDEMNMMLPIENEKNPVPDAVIRVFPWTRHIRRCTSLA